MLKSKRIDALQLFYSNLSTMGYDWSPKTPDQVLEARKKKKFYRPIVQLIGLGTPVSECSLIQDGLDETVTETLKNLHIFKENENQLIFSELSWSQLDPFWVVHDHWPPKAGEHYIHFGAESLTLIKKLKKFNWEQKNVFDLGCSSGGLLLSLSKQIRSGMGIDPSTRAIEWGTLSIAAQDVRNVQLCVGEVSAVPPAAAWRRNSWDAVIFNPPMMIPDPIHAAPHRDGGDFGIALPILFLDNAFHLLKTGGEVFCLVTNPIISGRGLLFEELRQKPWKILEKECLNPHFNQEGYRKLKAQSKGLKRLEHVELWFLRMMNIF